MMDMMIENKENIRPFSLSDSKEGIKEKVSHSFPYICALCNIVALFICIEFPAFILLIDKQ